MAYSEIIAVSSKIHTKLLNTPCKGVHARARARTHTHTHIYIYIYIYIYKASMLNKHDVHKVTTGL